MSSTWYICNNECPHCGIQACVTFPFGMLTGLLWDALTCPNCLESLDSVPEPVETGTSVIKYEKPVPVEELSKPRPCTEKGAR